MFSRNHKYTIVIWAAIAVLAVVFSVAAQTDTGTLKVAIRDKATGQVTPAMICITSLADNSWREPPDGRVKATFKRNLDIIAGRWKSVEYIAGADKKWFPGDHGPSLVMNGTFPDNITRDLWYFGGPAIPFWKEPAAYFVSKPFTIVLPPGKWRLAVMRGFEYVPVYSEFTVTAGQTIERDVTLARWTDMAKQGWYSGDPHVHSWRIAPVHDVYVTTFAKAMDVHMTVTMNYCQLTACTGCLQSQYGRAGRYHEGDYWVESGTEDPREGINEEGHVSQFDIQHPVRNTDKYQQYGYVFDGVHAQGGLVGYDHLAWSKTFYFRQDPKSREQHPYPGWDVNINTIRGKIDFFSILQNNSLGLEDYYDFLNLGVKVTATASTDYPAPVVGEETTYAYTGNSQPFTPDAWFDAVRRGRTFVSNGPMIKFTVNDALPGDEVRMAGGGKVHVRAEAQAPESIGSPKVLEIVVHGRVIKSAESRSPQQDKLALDFELPVQESEWIAARTTAHNGAVAHTTPVYVIVNNKGFFDRANLAQNVAKQLKALDFIETKRLRNPNFTRMWGPGLVAEVWKDVEDARARYLSLRDAPDRPPITGISNIAFRVSDIEKARSYYGNVLGYQEFSFAPSREEGPPEFMYFKVNDRQYIEVSPGLKGDEDRLIHVGFETEDAVRLRDYLASKGVSVPAKVTKDIGGNLSFTVKDPEGHTVEFVQYLPDSIQGRNHGNFMPKRRLSDHILHVGLHVENPAKSDAFWKDILGFRLLWEGGPATNPHAWISYLTPDGRDWLEYMTTPNPNVKQLASMHHVCLEVMDVQKPYETAVIRGYTPPEHPIVARDGRWLANFYDPDGSRTEFMIRRPVEKPCCTENHDPFVLR